MAFRPKKGLGFDDMSFGNNGELTSMFGQSNPGFGGGFNIGDETFAPKGYDPESGGPSSMFGNLGGTPETPGIDAAAKSADKWTGSKIFNLITGIGKALGGIEENYWASTGTPRGKGIREGRKIAADAQQDKIMQMMKLMEINAKDGGAESSIGKILKDAGKEPPYSQEDLSWAANIHAKGSGGGSSTSINMGSILDPETQKMLGQLISGKIKGMLPQVPQEVPTASGSSGPMSPYGGITIK